jgi:hypothetical protein
MRCTAPNPWCTRRSRPDRASSIQPSALTRASGEGLQVPKLGCQHRAPRIGADPPNGAGSDHEAELFWRSISVEQGTEVRRVYKGVETVVCRRSGGSSRCDPQCTVAKYCLDRSWSIARLISAGVVRSGEGMRCVDLSNGSVGALSGPLGVHSHGRSSFLHRSHFPVGPLPLHLACGIGQCRIH